MTTDTTDKWGELRSMLARAKPATHAQWQALLEHVSTFGQSDERQAASHYAARAMRAAPEQWPTSSCTWQYSYRHQQKPEPWQAPMVLGVSFDTLGTRHIPTAIDQLDIEGLDLVELVIEWFEVSLADLEPLMAMPALDNLRRFRLNNFDASSNTTPSITALDGLPLLGRIEHLELRHVTDHGSKATGEILGQCTRLESLGVYGGMYDKSSWKQLFAHLRRRLSKLDLSGSGMGGAAITIMNRAHILDALEVFRMARCDTGTASLKALSKIDNTCLHTLDMSSTNLGATGLQALGQASFLPTLRSLELEGNSLRPLGKALTALRDSSVCEQLEVLDLGSVGIGGKLGSTFFSPGFPRLHTLHLGNNNLGNVGLRALIESPMPRLRHLTMHWNSMEESALTSLTHANWPALESLQIGNYQSRLSESLLDELRAHFGEGVVHEYRPT